MRHKAKLLNYQGYKVRIDEEIAPLFTKLWKFGINTVSSCQAHCSFKCNHKVIKHPVDENGLQYFESIPTKHCGECIWIVFDTANDVERFYNYVAEYTKEYKNTMYSYINGWCYKEYPRDIWTLYFRPRNAGIVGHWGRPKWGNKRSTKEHWVEDKCKKNNFIMQPQLTFPRKHLIYVEQRLQLALDKKRK